ncbi:4385_t:CDS:2 [Ambispora gerdemannii]|uniref:protein-histidine N-methyltransferase n=1 Tax=Ambispora gerdemannii TaxID=144530 RepID=A0A9N9FN98_9GLOM|nr:4385_t:CDS:2 [Ambispora gerdemannii]
MSFRFNFSFEDLDLSDHEINDHKVVKEEFEIVDLLQAASLEEKTNEIPTSSFIAPTEIVISPLSLKLPESFIAETIEINSTLKESLSSSPSTLYKRHLSDIKCQIALDDDDPMEEHEDSSNIKKNQNLFDVMVESDLIKGVYEGGFKTWECSLDLVDYLAGRGINIDSLKVLELGCGSGLPGIYILTREKSARVDFQDYNEQVIKLVTIPNILLNTSLRPQATDIDNQGIAQVNVANNESVIREMCKRSRFFAGDWNGLVDALDIKSEKEKYDLILTSETIYNENSIEKLYNVIKNVLKRPNGVVLVSSKTMYFGVGGGILPFRQLVERDNMFDVEVVYTVTSHLRREILEMRFVGR